MFFEPARIILSTLAAPSSAGASSTPKTPAVCMDRVSTSASRINNTLDSLLFFIVYLRYQNGVFFILPFSDGRCDCFLTEAQLEAHKKAVENPHFSTAFCGDPGAIRTRDTCLRRAVLYPLSYGALWVGRTEERQSGRPHGCLGSCLVQAIS